MGRLEELLTTNYKKYVAYAYRKKIKLMVKENDHLKSNCDKEYSDKIDEYWQKKINKVWHAAYSSVNGIEDERYIPEDLFYSKIEPALNDTKIVPAFSDKNNYENLFDQVRQPVTVVRNKHGRFYTSDDHVIDLETAKTMVENQNGTLIIKPSLDSGGGKGVRLFDVANNQIVIDKKRIEFEELLRMYNSNFIVQEKVTQSSFMGKFHPASLNTLRIVTYKRDETVEFLSGIARFGNNESGVDNQAAGGVSCGVSIDGSMSPFAIDKNGNKFSTHPHTGVEFKNEKVPNFQMAVSMVKELHEQLHYFDLVSWDIALDENNEPLLIELNVQSQEINFHQFINGPLFKNFTDDVIGL